MYVCRFTVLCASSAGRLQLLDLQHQEHPHMRTLPLLPPARPTHITVHPHKPMLVVACQGTEGTWELRCIHAVTGATLGRYPMAPGEGITSICTWSMPKTPEKVTPGPFSNAPHQEPLPNSPVRSDSVQVIGTKTRAVERRRGSASSSGSGGARDKEDEGMGAGGSGQAEAEEQEEHHEQGYVCVVVSTGEERGQKARGVWSPCKGRLLLIHIGFEQDGMWLYLKAESKFTDHVHAVAVLPGCAAAVGLAEHGTLIAAVGRRLVAFSEPLTNVHVAHVGHFRKHHLIATAQPITCLSPSPSTKGGWPSTRLQHWPCSSCGRLGSMRGKAKQAVKAKCSNGCFGRQGWE
ncbi:hypothetical protein ABBQ38_004861 [Trebouxia sp. C0009 RCD-2024]